MQNATNHFLLVKNLKNTGSAQLCVLCSHATFQLSLSLQVLRATIFRVVNHPTFASSFLGTNVVRQLYNRLEEVELNTPWRTLKEEDNQFCLRGFYIFSILKNDFLHYLSN